MKAPTESRKLSNPPDKVEKRISLTQEQAKMIASTIPLLEKIMDRRLIALLLFTGMRRGEVLGLMWEDVTEATKADTGEVTREFNIQRSVTYPTNQPDIGRIETQKSQRAIPIAPTLWQYLQPVCTQG